MYLLSDTHETRRLAGHYIEVYHYPDGRIEPRANGVALPFCIYDRLSEIDSGAIVDNKRLSHVLQVAQVIQSKRDNRRSQSVPAGDGVWSETWYKSTTKPQFPRLTKCNS